jgi:hypothetical protein
MKNKTLKFLYKFHFNDGRKRLFEINIDSKTLLLTKPVRQDPPEWAKMSYFRCENCPLPTSKYKYCPLANHLSEVIEFFTDVPSFEKAIIFVENNLRGSYKYTSVQVGVSSLMGIIMASSGCPIIGKLKPLVRFHLPFASLEETEIRVLSMYILAQFFRMWEGKKTDFKLTKLRKLYEDIQKVNRNIVSKLAEIEIKDTNRNAVIALSNYADFISLSLSDEEIQNLKEFLGDFLEIE